MLAAGAAILATSGAAADDRPRKRPRIFALTHATVVPAPGERIVDGTVIVRDGLIESVGSATPVPPDAVVIDCAERWLYPGLIDAESPLVSGDDERGRPDRQRDAALPGAVHPNSRVRPELRARDALLPIPRVRPVLRARAALLPFDDSRRRELARRRALGFTTILATPDRGIFRGTSVVVQLADDREVAETILRDDVAHHVAFERGGFGREYPTSLMGAVALIRQTLLDTERYATWAARYEKHPLGLRRPDHRAAYQALVPVLQGELPLVFTIDDPLDALLADRLGREFGARVVIAGSGHEWELADRLAATGRDLILSVAFPDPPAVDEPDEALDVTRQELRRHLEAPSGPGRLHRAGVRFALTTRGLKNLADLTANMRRIIEAGLPPDVALAAWTTVPAELLGINRASGTIAPGKIANLVVTDGPLFGKETTTHLVFVDGERYEIEAKQKPAGDPDAVVDPRGEWSVVFEIPGRSIQRTWTIDGEQGRYRGTAETERGIVSFDRVVLAGNVLTVTYPARGGRGSSEVTVVIEGDSFKGLAEMGSRTIDVRGKRTRGPDAGGR